MKIAIPFWTLLFSFVVCIWIRCSIFQVKGDANFPTTPDGRTYHLEVKSGDVSNRVVIVGDMERALDFSSHLNQVRFKHQSERGFLTITGTYNEKEVTVIATGMGYPMIDFSLRETRHVVNGSMAMIRIGTCGTPSSEIELGDVVVTNSTFFIRRDPDLYRAQKFPYVFTNPIEAHQPLSNLLYENMRKFVNNNSTVWRGLGTSTDSFYSSQARITDGFYDRNQDLMEKILAAYPSLKTIEMEMFHLFDLANASRGKLLAAGGLIVIAQRNSDQFIDISLLKQVEKLTGIAALETITNFQLPNHE